MTGEKEEKEKKDLVKQLEDKRNALRNFRFGIAGSKIKNVKEARGIRKDIARILTKLNASK
jgi:ribosomal protein L29